MGSVIVVESEMGLKRCGTESAPCRKSAEGIPSVVVLGLPSPSALAKAGAFCEVVLDLHSSPVLVKSSAGDETP